MESTVRDDKSGNPIRNQVFDNNSMRKILDAIKRNDNSRNNEKNSNIPLRKNGKGYCRPEYMVDLKQHMGTNVFILTETERINTLEVNADDIWVVSFPRSGTTLTQEIVYLISSGLDFKAAKSEILDLRFPFLDLCDPRFPDMSGVDCVERKPAPRRIKSHFHFHAMPPGIQAKKCKIVYVARNPKDVILSYYYFTKHLRSNDPELSLEEFTQAFLADLTYGTPWWLHVKDYWKQRNHENVLFLFYEDLVKNIAENISKIGKFLGKDLSIGDIERIAEHCNFQNMKENPTINGTSDMIPIGEQLRKGKIGSWKEQFTPEMSRDVEKMVEDKLGDTDLFFTYEDKDRE